MMLVALIARDLRRVWIGGGALLPVAFFLLVAILFPFAVGPDSVLLARVGGGVLWAAALLGADPDRAAGRSTPRRRVARPAWRDIAPGRARPVDRHPWPRRARRRHRRADREPARCRRDRRADAAPARDPAVDLRCRQPRWRHGRTQAAWRGQPVARRRHAVRCRRGDSRRVRLIR